MQIRNNKEDIKGAETSKKIPNLKKYIEYFLIFMESIIFAIL